MQTFSHQNCTYIINYLPMKGNYATQQPLIKLLPGSDIDLMRPHPVFEKKAGFFCISPGETDKNRSAQTGKTVKKH